MNLAWIDTETTGLDTNRCERLEIGLVVTTPDLTIVHTESHCVYDERRSDPVGLNDPFIVKMHTDNGLWVARQEGGKSLAEAEQSIVSSIVEHGAKGSPMCGSTISFDRAMLADSPILKVLHYRNIDVSTLRNLAEQWGYAIAPKGVARHRCVSDCLDSIVALEHYRRVMFAGAP